MHQASHARSRAGFTLIELLMVIAIIAVQAAIVLAGISGVRNKGYDAKEINDLKQLEIALNAFKADKKIYPPSRIILFANYIDYNQANPLHKDSLQVINRVWPNIGAFSGINWASVLSPTAVPP